MKLVAIKGAGEMATAVAHKLFMAGFKVVMSELARPLAVRRQVAFAQAVYQGVHTVEGITAVKTHDPSQIMDLSLQGKVPIYVGEFDKEILGKLGAMALVDAMVAKENFGTGIDDADIVIALGPGFRAGIDVHAVIETNRGHDLARIYYQGEATPNTSEPGEIAGFSLERVLKAPVDGIFKSQFEIGQQIEAGGIFGFIGDMAIKAQIPGVVRGVLHSGLEVKIGTKLGDIDPRGNLEYCNTISDKGRAIAGGVLEALLHLSGSVEQ